MRAIIWRDGSVRLQPDPTLLTSCLTGRVDSARARHPRCTGQTLRAACRNFVSTPWPRSRRWQFGQVSSVSVDAQDHIWILQRPGTLGPEERTKAAPPVLEFTAEGNCRAWGGPGRDMSGHPPSTGSMSTRRGSCGLVATERTMHQILKFTKDGTFVMQIGKAGTSKGTRTPRISTSLPTRSFTPPPTSLRGRRVRQSPHHRVRRRHGQVQADVGAFGKTPTDEPPNPAPAERIRTAPRSSCSRFTRLACRRTAWSTSRIEAASACRCSGSTAPMSPRYSSDASARLPNAATARRPPARRSPRIPRSVFSTSAIAARQRSWSSSAATLELLDSFGEWGSAPGQFGTLHHMAADSKGNLYVTEVTPLRPENRRVQKFVLTGTVAIGSTIGREKGGSSSCAQCSASSS